MIIGMSSKMRNNILLSINAYAHLDQVVSVYGRGDATRHISGPTSNIPAWQFISSRKVQNAAFVKL